MRAHGFGLPWSVERTFSRYLDCGVWREVFAAFGAKRPAAATRCCCRFRANSAVISAERIEDPRNVLEPDQTVMVQVISIDPAERKIGLSIKSAERHVETADVHGYSPGTTGGATLGDVFAEKFGRLGGGDSEEEPKSE